MAYCQKTPGYIKYFPNWDLQNFLMRHKPSEITDPSVFWVSVDHPELRAAQKSDVDLSSVSAYWEQISSDTNTNVNPEDIKALASASGYTSGKWMIFRKADQVDEVWSKVATAVVAGTLGHAAKVSSRSSSESCKGQNHVICIYTADFTDQSDVFGVEQVIRSLGVKGRLHYKSDLYTELGIYQVNPWGLKPCIYVTDG